jgi:hypothetical protein
MMVKEQVRLDVPQLTKSVLWMRNQLLPDVGSAISLAARASDHGRMGTKLDERVWTSH